MTATATPAPATAPSKNPVLVAAMLRIPCQTGLLARASAQTRSPARAALSVSTHGAKIRSGA
jgi:hypothetical protein